MRIFYVWGNRFYRATYKSNKAASVRLDQRTIRFGQYFELIWSRCFGNHSAAKSKRDKAMANGHIRGSEKSKVGCESLVSLKPLECTDDLHLGDVAHGSLFGLVHIMKESLPILSRHTVGHLD